MEDDPMVQEVNKQFIERVEGFKVVGIASNGVEGVKMVHALKPDLAVIDIFMPDQDGLETISYLRNEEHPIDVIAVTAANDMETVRRVLQHGAVDYIMKPFKFERIKQALENYNQYRRTLHTNTKISQAELDSLLHNKTYENRETLPKGLNAVTLNKIVLYLSNIDYAVSAEEVAEGVGLARVTARRYLEYLEKVGKVQITIQYGGVGRPVNRYMINQ
ncbi:response regulator [Bacillus tianshenii]|nr:response regulator [Bacillus tianshenii]